LQVLLVKQLIKSNHLSHISPPFCHNIKNIKDSDEKLKRNTWKKKIIFIEAQKDRSTEVQGDKQEKDAQNRCSKAKNEKQNN